MYSPNIAEENIDMLSEDEFKALLGLTIKKMRYEKNISCEKLAVKSNIDYSTLNLIENGKQTPRAYVLYKILAALDVDVVSFLTNDRLIPSPTERLIAKIQYLDAEHVEALNKLTDDFDIRKKSTAF